MCSRRRDLAGIVGLRRSGLGRLAFAAALVGLLAAAALAAATSTGAPAGKYSGVLVPYEKLGGPRRVSFTVAGTRVSALSVGAGKVFCHLANVPGEGDLTAHLPAL